MIVAMRHSILSVTNTVFDATAVPIIPEFLYELHKRERIEQNKTFFETSTTAFPPTTSMASVLMLGDNFTTDNPGAELLNSMVRSTTSDTM